MPEIDIPTIQRTLVATKRREQQARERPAAAGASAEERFRQGAASRRRVFDLLSGITAPSTPQGILLDKPFLIWAFRNYDKPTNMLVDSHVEPGNSSAQIGYWYDNGGDFLRGSRGQLLLHVAKRRVRRRGRRRRVAPLCQGQRQAHGAWRLDTPIRAVGGWDRRRRRNLVECKTHAFGVVEPAPTQPLQQASQSRDVTHLKAEGSWVPVSAINNESVDVADSFHVNYDAFLVPAKSVAIFEVSLRIGVEGYDGNIKVDFDDPFGLILCPRRAASPKPDGGGDSRRAGLSGPELGPAPRARGVGKSLDVALARDSIHA